jgi:uncharacterized membrane protein
MVKKIITLFTVVLTLLIGIGASTTHANASLYTPYSGITATPGETIEYTIDVINNESEIQTYSFEVENLPEGWSHTISSNGSEIRQLSVRGNSEQKINIEVTVPLEINQADYRFNLVATDQDGSRSTLPFLVTLSEKGTFKTEFTVDQPNLQGHTDSSFSYSAKLHNRTAEKQNYALTAKIPQGWGVQFQTGGENVTSVSVAPNSQESVTINVTPPENASADTYKLQASAAGSGTSEKVDLEAVITGSYDLLLTTPNGNLSTDLQSGQDKTLDLVVKNTGTAPLTNVKLSATAPPDWETKFEPSTIPEIAAGETTTIKATITASDEAIAGDYVTTFSASAAESTTDAQFRVSVETSTLWGLIGIAIIVAVVVGFYLIIKKYGRR